jgi:hypothetical protein
MEGINRRNIEVNIVGNEVDNEYGVYRNYRNNFGKE